MSESVLVRDPSCGTPRPSVETLEALSLNPASGICTKHVKCPGGSILGSVGTVLCPDPADSAWILEKVVSRM